MNASPFLPPPPLERAASPLGFPLPAAQRTVEHHGADRRTAEAFIAACYARRFGAQITAFMPRLFTLRDEAHGICAAFGLRCAQHRLFSERYLDAPIEQLIAGSAGRRVERREIVEVGHLCGAYVAAGAFADAAACDVAAAAVSAAACACNPAAVARELATQASASCAVSSFGLRRPMCWFACIALPAPGCDAPSEPPFDSRSANACSRCAAALSSRAPSVPATP